MKHLLVPCDLREESVTALRVAGQLADKMHARITLLHVAADESTAQGAHDALEVLKNRLEQEVRCVIATEVCEGDFLVEIGRSARELEADMTVMITHGLQGDQIYSGSLALQVITEAGLPFLVVQSSTSTTLTGAKTLLALEYRQSSKEEMDLIITFLKALGAEVELFLHRRESHQDPREWDAFFTESLNEAGVVFRVTQNDKYDFSKAAVDHAINSGCQLIVALNFSHENLYSISPRTDEEDLIYNSAAIPVLLITPMNQDSDLEKPEELL
jgi:nucleotide-binding universal stress UspA family protein